MSNVGRLEQTTLLADIKSVAEAQNDHPRWSYITGILHTKTEDIGIPKLIVLRSTKRYAEDTSGFKTINFIMGKGDYFYRMYPVRDNLEFSITYQGLTSTGAHIPGATHTTRYKAVYKPDVNPSPQMDTDSNRSIDELNTQGHVDVELELQELFEEPYRFLTINGTYSNTAKDLLTAACLEKFNAVKINGKPMVEAVHVEEPHNRARMDDLSLPSGLELRDLPGYLQQFGDGVYNSGIGNFIDRFKDKVTWFTYPLYDLKRRFEADVEKLIIYFAPQDRFYGVENTYRKEGKITYILTTSTPPAYSNANNDELNRGAGIRMVNTTAMTTKPADLSGPVMKANSRRLNSEMVGRDRPDQVNYARVVGSNSNQFFELSKILKNQTTYVDIAWNYADLDTVYPAMPVKCVFMNQGIYEEKYGVVHSLLDVVRAVGNPMTSDKYKTDIELKLAIEPIVYIPPVQEGESYQDRKW